MNKNILYLVLIVLVGFSAYQVGQSSSNDVELELSEQIDSPDYKAKYEGLQEKFSDLDKVDIEEYLQLKTQKEKYEKADEILTKIMKIFLVNLGLRISQDRVKSVETHLSGKKSNSRREEVVSKERSKPELGKTRTKSVEKSIKSSTASRSGMKSSKKKIEKKVEYYHGEITFLGKKKKPWYIKLKLDGLFYINGDFKGSEYVMIFPEGEGKKFSLNQKPSRSIKKFL